MEHFDVISNDSMARIIFYAMFCCGILIPIFQYLGQRDAVKDYQKGIIRKVVPWVLLCVLLCEVGLLGYQLYQYPWSVEPQPSQASMFRQIRSMCEYPIWGFANDYQLPILSNLAGVVFWVCWTAYAFSFRPSAASWWKKVCKVIAYVILSATILGFYVHEFKDFLVYGVILLVVIVLLKIAHVRHPKEQKPQLSTKAQDEDRDKAIVLHASESNSEKESPVIMPPTLPQEEKQNKAITDSNDQDMAITNNNASAPNDDHKIDKESINTEDAPSENTYVANTNINKEDDEGMMYCKYCGKRINADSVYCRYCGRKL